MAWSALGDDRGLVAVAVAELGRALRPGAVVEIGRPPLRARCRAGVEVAPGAAGGDGLDRCGRWRGIGASEAQVEPEIRVPRRRVVHADGDDVGAGDEGVGRHDRRGEEVLGVRFLPSAGPGREAEGPCRHVLAAGARHR